MAQDYDKKRALLVEARKDCTLPDNRQLSEFWSRLCAPPFRTSPETCGVWLELWPLLSAEGRRFLSQLPDPCLNHVEDRMKSPKRAHHLSRGLKRLVEHDENLVLEGLRLDPHAVCRSATTIGPLPESLWDENSNYLSSHRLWLVGVIREGNFWTAADRLYEFRALPQIILDHMDQERPRESQDLEEFIDHFNRYLIRHRIEKIRTRTYALLSELNGARYLKIGTTT